MKTRIALLTLIILSVVFRLLNVSPHKIYPDSYQNLLVAKNIRDYSSVVGFMGEGGRIYPDFFIWTRPVYPLLINMLRPFLTDDVQTAQAVSILTGILAILVAYFLLKKMFASSQIGLLGAFLLTFSFNHTVWGGFILTETTGVLVILILLWNLFSTISRKPLLAGWRDFLTGAFFTIAVFTRYEYIILLLPVSFLIFSLSPKPLVRLTNIVVSMTLVFAVFLTQLFPLKSALLLLFNQFPDLVLRSAVVMSLFILISFLIKRFSTKNSGQRIHRLLVGAMWVFALYLIVQIMAPSSLPFLERNLAGVRNFFSHEILLGIFFLLGVTFLSRQKAYGVHLKFCVLSILVLSAFYYRINPEAQRYWTHMIPFLLMPAAYGLWHLTETRNKIVTIFLIALIAWQTSLTVQGIRDWRGGEWFRSAYEERSARMLANRTNDKKALLIVSFPEPYYYFSSNPTHSVSDMYPYVYIDNTLNNRKVIVVVDEGMRDLFPHFAQFVETKLGGYKKGEFFAGERYHYLGQARKEQKPVIFYELTLKDLKTIILKVAKP